MPDIEELLREELKRTARTVQPEVLRPLRVPRPTAAGVAACSRSRRRPR